MSVFDLIALAILCLVTAGVLMWHASRRGKQLSRHVSRLEAIIANADFPGGYMAPSAQKSWLPPVLETWLERAGFSPEPRLYGLLALPAPILVGLGLALFGIKGGVLGLLAVYPTVMFLFMRWRIERFQGLVVAQLPGFIDSVARILSIGSSLELAFRNASEESDEPLRGITAQMLLRTRAGVALEDAMNQVADTYDIKELSFMASVFYLGVRYGGNARVVLERIAQAMRERERSQQELHAMTSETRASAWILSALPIVVGLMILVSNPRYLVDMWNDTLGHKLLLAAFALQVIGMWLLFHMARLRHR